MFLNYESLLSQKFAAYLNAYSDKDLAQISTMFSDDIHLRDWKISVHGKELAMHETKKNFESAKSIAIDILHMYEASDAVAGELRIVVDGTEVLHVVDVVTFNSEGLITSIRAYIGREDC